MPYVKASIKKAKGAAGAASPKNPNLIIIDVEDIENYPGRDGVESIGNITLKAGAKAMTLYCTPSTIANPEESGGEAGREQITDKLTAFCPGIDRVMDAWLQEKYGEDFLIITKVCNGVKQTLLHGQECNPMKLQYTKQDDKDARGYTLTFTQPQGGKFKPLYYSGTIPEIAAAAVRDEDGSAGSGSAGDGIG